MKRLSYMAATVALVTLTIASTGWAQGTKSLYDRLGGRTAIVAVVDEFVANCAGDARINKFFAATAGPEASRNVQEQPGRPGLRGVGWTLRVHGKGHEVGACRAGDQQP